jgi:hypothetical protein
MIIRGFLSKSTLIAMYYDTLNAIETPFIQADIQLKNEFYENKSEILSCLLNEYGIELDDNENFVKA